MGANILQMKTENPGQNTNQRPKETGVYYWYITILKYTLSLRL